MENKPQINPTNIVTSASLTSHKLEAFNNFLSVFIKPFGIQKVSFFQFVNAKIAKSRESVVKKVWA